MLGKASCSTEGYIGVDVGTGSCKAVLLDAKGTIITWTSITYPILSPKPGWNEHDPDVVFNAVLKAIYQTVRQSPSHIHICGVGFSGYFHSVLPVDAKGKPLTNCILWTDTRSNTLPVGTRTADHDRYLHTGCPTNPIFSAWKILWIRTMLEDVFRKAKRFLSMKEYILARLTGNYVVDWSTASGTGLFNITELDWDASALASCGLSPRKLSPPTSPFTVLRGLKAEYASEIRLPSSTPIVVGAADGACSQVGSGAVRPLAVDNCIGSGGAVRIITEEPCLDKKERFWCCAFTERQWLSIAPSVGGLAFKWFITQFGKEEGEYDVWDRYAEGAPPGAEGLIFLPYLVGAMSPYWNPQARGAFLGLALHHQRKHFARAIMEGITYARYAALRALEEVVGQTGSIRATGGFIRCKTWLQIASDVFGRELLVPDVPDTAAVGAALIAMVALGQLTHLSDVEKIVRIKERYYPHPATHALYMKLYNLFLRAYEAYANELSTLADLQGNNYFSGIKGNDTGE